MELAGHANEKQVKRSSSLLFTLYRLPTYCFVRRNNIKKCDFSLAPFSWKKHKRKLNIYPSNLFSYISIKIIRVFKRYLTVTCFWILMIMPFYFSLFSFVSSDPFFLSFFRHHRNLPCFPTTVYFLNFPLFHSIPFVLLSKT